MFDGTEDGRISVIDLDARRRDGTLCPIQAHFSRMVYGERDCIICVFNDNSERKELEREVLQVATRIQQRIGGDLHDEVGQQLAGIAMMLQGLVNARRQPAQARRCARTWKRSSSWSMPPPAARVRWRAACRRCATGARD